jgi:hypothetical protein
MDAEALLPRLEAHLREQATFGRPEQHPAAERAARDGLFAEAERVERRERVRRDREPRADGREPLRLLDDVHLVTGAADRYGRGETADPASDDEHPQRRWQFGQYQVPRPATRVFSIGVPQRGHGSPARP